MPESSDNAENSSLIVFTDLDGTLLDHETYSYEPAIPAIRKLRELNVPLVLASSKTAAEIEALRRELGFDHCEAIVENGAGILPAGNDVSTDGETYETLLGKVSDLPSGLRQNFHGFSRWTADELAEITGLNHEAARLAKLRQFSEPGLWQGAAEELETFKAALAEQGIIAQKGGRFITLSFGGNKVDRMNEIMTRHQRKGSKPLSMALGDAPNDLAMLKAADLGVIIPNPAHAGLAGFLGEDGANIVHAPFSGPKGWNAVVLDVLLKREPNVAGRR